MEHLGQPKVLTIFVVGLTVIDKKVNIATKIAFGCFTNIPTLTTTIENIATNIYGTIKSIVVFVSSNKFGHVHSPPFKCRVSRAINVTMSNNKIPTKPPISEATHLVFACDILRFLSGATEYAVAIAAKKGLYKVLAIKTPFRSIVIPSLEIVPRVGISLINKYNPKHIKILIDVFIVRNPTLKNIYYQI